MSDQPSPVNQKFATRAARVIAILVVALSAILAAYSLSRLEREVPDAYTGQIRGGLSLSLSMLTGSAAQLVGKQHVRLILGLVSLVFVATAMYFYFGQPGVDTHLQRGYHLGIDLSSDRC